MAIGVLVGIGITAFLLLYLMFKLKTDVDAGGQNHFILQLLLLFFIIGTIALLGKATMDESSNCEWLTNQTSELYVYGNNFTGYHWDYDTGTAPDGPQVDAYLFHKNITYDYGYYCSDSINNTGLNFYKTIMWLVRLLFTYIFLYLTYEILKYLGWVVPK